MEKLLFGELIKKERKRLGMTQLDLADAVENLCTSSYISYLERNFVRGKDKLPKPDVEVIDGLATALKIPLKAARDAALLSLPSGEPSRGNALESIFSMLFVGYERLNPFYREMAITLCGGILTNLYELQIGNPGSVGIVPLMQGTQRNSSGLTTVPVVYAQTEAEAESIESAVETTAGK